MTRCAATVLTKDRFPRRVPCSASGKYHEDGKDWCGTHRPSRVAAKREARAARWNAKQQQWEHERALTAAREAVIVAARVYVSPFLYVGTGDASVASEKLVDAVENLDRLEATDVGE